MSRSESRKNFLWNTLGAGLNSFHSPLFLVLVSRQFGLADAGYFSLAFATGVLLSNVGLFSVRSYQITDISGEHTDSVYLSARLISTGGMILLTIGYALLKLPDSTLLVWLLILQGLWRVPEVLADCLHGSLQMKGRLDLAGKSLFLRAVLCVLAFAVGVYVFEDLLLANLALIFASLLVFVAVDIPSYRRVCPGQKIRFSFEVRALLRACFPLFLTSLLYAYLLNAQRYAIDWFGSPEIQTQFSILILPASLIWALFILAMNPLLPRLADSYFTGRRKEFGKTVRLLLISVLVMSVAGVLGMKAFGIRLFEYIFKTELSRYEPLFYIACAGAGFLCAATVFSNLLVLIREKRRLLISYAFVAILTFGISALLIRGRELTGGAEAYLAATFLLFLVLSGGFYFADRERTRSEEENTAASGGK